MKAVIHTGGKQYIVEAGQTITIEKLPEAVGSEVVFDKVLLVGNADGTDVKIGAPFLAGVTVKGTVEEQKKDKKIRVVRFKRKVRFHKVHGHRQHITKVKITKIG
jgi:large subunit ribosomal protein L21